MTVVVTGVDRGATSDENGLLRLRAQPHGTTFLLHPATVVFDAGPVTTVARDSTADAGLADRRAVRPSTRLMARFGSIIGSAREASVHRAEQRQISDGVTGHGHVGVSRSTPA